MRPERYSTFTFPRASRVATFAPVSSRRAAAGNFEPVLSRTYFQLPSSDWTNAMLPFVVGGNTSTQLSFCTLASPLGLDANPGPDANPLATGTFSSDFGQVPTRNLPSRMMSEALAARSTACWSALASAFQLFAQLAAVGLLLPPQAASANASAVTAVSTPSRVCVCVNATGSTAARRGFAAPAAAKERPASDAARRGRPCT